MAKLKIENYETFKSDISADTFEFPYNPTSFKSTVQKFVDRKEYAYFFTFFGNTNPLKSSRRIVCNGHFSGDSKNSNYRELVSNMIDNKIKKLYFSADKFYIVFPKEPQETRTGNRINFIDYVVTFSSPFSICFSDTQKGGSETNLDTNDGNTFAPIEVISGDVTEGTEVSIIDKNGNGFTFTPSETGTFYYRLIYFISYGRGVYFTEYNYGYITERQKLKINDSSKDLILGLEPNESLDDIFSTGTISGISNIDIKFRDSYTGD